MLAKQIGIKLYKNYKGIVYNNKRIKDLLNEEIKLPSNIVLELDKDLIYESEKQRINVLTLGLHNMYMDEEDMSSKSKKFGIIYTGNLNEMEKINIISKDGEAPNCEWKSDIKINSFLWVNDEQLIYSQKNKGIYLYNANSRETYTIVEGNEEYILKSYENGELMYDNKQINL